MIAHARRRSTLALLCLAGVPALLGAVVDGGRRVPAAGAQSARQWVRQAVRESSHAPDGLLDPRGIDDGPGGVFYVTDSGHDRIVVVDGAGAVVRAFGAHGDGPSGLSEPSDVAVDAARDRVFVADRANRRVAVFTLTGTPVAHWVVAGPQHAFVPWAVAVAAATGDVYVVSRLPWGRVERFATDGRWIAGWGSIGGGPGEFRYPEDLAVHPDGRVLVADTNNNRLEVFDAAGNHQADLRDVTAVRGVEVDPANGQIYALYAGDRVRVYLAGGTQLREVRSDALAEPFGPAARIGVGEGGRLAVTTGFGASGDRQGLRQYDAAGALLAATLADPRAHEGFFRPDAIATGPDGSLYVLDTPVRTTRRFAPAGAPLGRLDEAVGNELTVGPGGDVYVVSTAPTGPVSLRQVAPDGRSVWERTCGCFNGMGVAADATHLLVTEALSRTIAVYRPLQVETAPQLALGIAGSMYTWPLDVALGPDGRAYAAGGETGRIDVLDTGSGLVASWAVPEPGGAERISVGPDGTIFALLADGSVAVYRSDGSRETTWRPEPAPGAPLVRPKDLAAGPGGRLYLLDGFTWSIFVYTPETVAPTVPPPTATPGSPCTVVGDKTASPGVVTLGGEATVRLTLDIRCPAGSQTRADIVLVLDRSNSMAGTKLDDAKAAAQAFTSGLDLSRHRVALVSFSDITALDQALTNDASAIRAAIAAVQAHGGTDIASALDRALLHLEEAQRPGALGVVLLLTDGEPSGEGQPYVDPVRLGARARARGMLVYTIGLGANVDEALLTAVAGSTGRYYFAPTASELDAIYRQLSASVGGAVASDVQVVDDLGADVEFVAGSASGAPVETGRRVTWQVGTIPSGGMPVLSLRVLPRRLGLVPTNSGAVARYTAAGQRYTYTFPVPQVQVIDVPTATATATRTATPTPTATPRPSVPSTVYLPALMKRSCPKDQRRAADVMLVLDTSSSMAGEKMVRAIAAARDFVTLFEPSRDRVGLVSFDSAARTVPLTGDLASVRAALDGLPTHEGTRIDLGLYEAMREFYYHGRADAAHVAVLLTDGQPMGGSLDATIEQASQMRDYGVTLYAIGLGTDADGTLLRSLATSATHYYHAPTPEDLAAIYDRIAVRLPCR
jgi:Mg-chelatase subunit ChlD/sugar lactone lactonase YvrE